MACQILFGALQCIRETRIYSPSAHCSHIDEHPQIDKHINSAPLLDIKLCTKCSGMMVVGVEFSSGHFAYICSTDDCAKISLVVCQGSSVGKFSLMIVIMFIFGQFD